MGTRVSIREVVDALDCASDETSSYVNAKTGEVRTLTDSELQFAEEESESDLAEWQREAVAEAKQVLASGEWLQLPSTFEIHEWELMNQFGRSRSAPAERAELDGAIHGKGAFRSFKSTVR